MSIFSTSVFWQFPWRLFGLVGLATSSQAQTRPEMQILPTSKIVEWSPINTKHHALTGQYLPRQIEACLVLRKRIILQQNPKVVKFRTQVATLWSCRLSGPFSQGKCQKSDVCDECPEIDIAESVGTVILNAGFQDPYRIPAPATDLSSVHQDRVFYFWPIFALHWLPFLMLIFCSDL